MHSGMKSLDSLMEECLPAGGVMVKGGRGLYMEVREKASGTVWMSLDPVTKEDFASLELSEEYEPLGFARASMDRALFVHSPDDEMQPVLFAVDGFHTATPILISQR